MKYRLAILDSHPIQYRAPLFKKLAQHPQIDLCVYYWSGIGATEYKDKEFTIKFKWDIPLLEGYHYKFLRKDSSYLLHRLWRLFNLSIIRELKKKQYDAVIIFGYSSLANWFVSLATSFLKIPIFFNGETILYNHSPLIKNIFLKLFFCNINACFYIGTKSFQFYRHLMIPQERLFFMPYCVDNNFFINEINKWRPERERIKKEIEILNDYPIILYASKLISRKRPQDTIRAFANLCTKANLVFVGDGKLKPYLEDLVFKNKIKNVFFLGFKNQTELPRYYAIADIFILPSSFEPWGLVVNEAMCAGLPIITTDKVAVAYDLVKEGINGFILKVGDIDGLTRTLEDLISDTRKRKNMALKSLEIISEWNYDTCISGIIEALEFISNGHRKHPYKSY